MHTCQYSILIVCRAVGDAQLASRFRSVTVESPVPRGNPRSRSSRSGKIRRNESKWWISHEDHRGSQQLSQLVEIFHLDLVCVDPVWHFIVDANPWGPCQWDWASSDRREAELLWKAWIGATWSNSEATIHGRQLWHPGCTANPLVNHHSSTYGGFHTWRYPKMVG